MKKKFKILTILLVTSVFISSISFGAFGEDSGSDIAYLPELQNGTETELEESADTSSVDEERDFIDETETAYFEFTEADLSSSSRAIGGGEVDFGPPEDDSTTLVVTSAIIPDGVYAIESVFAPGLWIDVNGSAISGTQVWQDYHSTPTNSFNRIALFKIKYVATTQSYVIRLMTNNMLTLGFDELGNVITKTISSPYDGQVQPSETFTITRMTNGYMIRQYGETNDALASKTDGGGELYIPDSFLKKRPASEAGDKAIWKFYKYTGADRHGMLISYNSSYTSVGIPVGTTGTMNSKTWSTVIGSNIPHMQAESNSTAMISTSYNYYIGEMSFTALSPGYATIQSMILRESTGTSQYTERKYFQIIPQEGTFFIKNAYTEKYIEVESPFIDDGNAIQQNSFSAESPQRWIIEHAGNGYVRIKSGKSGKYVGIVETDSTYRAGQYSAQADYTLWKIERTTSGNLKLVCKAFSNTLALAPPSISNGADLALATYTNDSDYKDEWNIDIRKASLIALPENFNRSDYFDELQTLLNCIGYVNSYNNHATIVNGVTKSEMLNYMKTSQITLIRTHGSKISISVTGGSLTRSDLLALPNNYLSTSDLIIYGACLTANGGETDTGNLVNATLSAGARTVIGFENSVEAGACNYWCKWFFHYFAVYYFDDSKTLFDVCIQTDELAAENCTSYEYYKKDGTLVSLRNYVIVGDTSIPK